jgi:16S rRNA U1498 N3-methylase RsmE
MISQIWYSNVVVIKQWTKRGISCNMVTQGVTELGVGMLSLIIARRSSYTIMFQNSSGPPRDVLDSIRDTE